jgi:hypothetical protein
MAINKKEILFYFFTATALVVGFFGAKRILNFYKKDEIDLSDSDYTLSYKKFKSQDSKNNGIVFEYSYKNQATAKKIENLTKQSFNIFDRYKVDVDSITNRPYFELVITDLKNPKEVIKKSVLIQ